ncbi:hypothetical protein PoB_007138800 [Plakobranchus ocellatus]|uniref:Uncharacterized protein n=1 Tax=Plakobranchus ocellatus TaxID=259542 RepID=A0AAV4DKS5_9GAST|nr:hypothetical protein PoB_007138800 [Plakobranchus ocellatus]
MILFLAGFDRFVFQLYPSFLMTKIFGESLRSQGGHWVFKGRPRRHREISPLHRVTEQVLVESGRAGMGESITSGFFTQGGGDAVCCPMADTLVDEGRFQPQPRKPSTLSDVRAILRKDTMDF